MVIKDMLAPHQTPERHPLLQHLTVSAVVIHRAHVLLVHHKRIGAWLPPGGHVEPAELPHEAAIREVLEETGVAVQILSERLPNTGDPDAFLLPSPLCLHAVVARERGDDVYHVDIVYLCRPVFADPREDFLSVRANEELHDARWVALAEISELPLAKNVVEVVQKAIEALGLLPIG